MPLFNKYKQIIYIIGTTATGKTTTAEALRYFLNADVINADNFYDFIGIIYDRVDYDKLTQKTEWNKYDDIEDWRKRWYSYELSLVRNSPNRTLVVEGATLINKEEKELIESMVKAPVTTLLLEPSEWELMYSRKHGMRADRRMLDRFRKNIDFDYTLITDLKSLVEPFVYQRVGFTDKKWNALRLEHLEGKSMLDLGCSTGWFNMYAVGNNIGKYVGVDNNWRQIMKARSDHYGEFILSDIENFLNDNTERFDIIVMASTLHYFNNKEKIIERISKITREQFILEIPVSKEEELREYTVEGKDYTIPSIELVNKWLSKYFNNYETIGESPAPDGSYRLVFKGYK